MELSQRFFVSDDVVSREVGGETVLLDLESGLYFGLDPVGGRIWELLSDEPKSLTSICDTIELEFDAKREQIENDMVVLMRALSDKNLVVEVSD